MTASGEMGLLATVAMKITHTSPAAIKNPPEEATCVPLVFLMGSCADPERYIEEALRVTMVALDDHLSKPYCMLAATMLDFDVKVLDIG